MFKFSINFVWLLLFAPPVLVAQSAPTRDGFTAWKISDEPVLQINGLWGSIGGVIRLTSGNLIVTDYMGREILLYSPEGQLLASEGREGEGPGEFRLLMRPMQCGEGSIYFYDPALGRLSVFDSELNFQRVFNSSDIQAGGYVHPEILRCNSKAAFVSTVRKLVPPTSEGVFLRDVKVHVGREGREVITLDDSWSDEMLFEGYNLLLRPFGTETIAAMSEDRLYVRMTDQFAIDVYSLTGEFLGTISDDVPRERFTAQMLDAFVETREEEHRAGWRAMDHPEMLPVFSDLLVDDLGNLWVEEYRDPTEEYSTWRVYSPQGQLNSTLVVPERFELHQVGSDFVLGVWRDSMDVEHVQMFGLEKR